MMSGVKPERDTLGVTGPERYPNDRVSGVRRNVILPCCIWLHQYIL